MKTPLSLLFLLLPLWLVAAPPLAPLQHNFFTTNPAPVVDVVAGSNTVVTPSLIGTDTRRFTVSATATPSQTNWPYTSITNAPWGLPQTNISYTEITNLNQWASTNLLSPFATNSSNSTNFWGVLSPTNLPAGLSTSNYVGTFTGNGSGLTNLPTTSISPGATNQVLTQTGWSGYPQITNLSLITNGIGTAVVPSLWLTNPTPAALGAQQNSPVLMQAGQGWRSGNSTTMPVAMGWGVVPVQGSAANPTAQYTLYNSINNATPTSTGLYFTDSGNILWGTDGGGNIGGVNVNRVGTIRAKIGAVVGGAFIDGTVGPYGQATFNYVLVNNSYSAGPTGTSAEVALGGNAAPYPSIYLYSTAPPTIGFGVAAINANRTNGVSSLIASNAILWGTLTATNGLTSHSSNNVVDVENLGSTVTPALWLTNGTAAALGAQQNSPVFMQAGQGWRSGNSTTMPVSMGWGVVPVQGSGANPFGYLNIYSSVSNAVPTVVASINSQGAFSAGANSGGLSGFNMANGNEGMVTGSGNYEVRFNAGVGGNTGFYTFDINNKHVLTMGDGAGGMDGWFRGNLTVTNSIIASNITASATVTATNGLYYVPQNNGTNPANSLQPAFAWGALMGTTTNLINGGINTYQAITNYTIARTNQFGANLATGTLTNLIAGFYRIGIHFSGVAVDAGALIEGALFLNGVERDEVGFLSAFDPGTPRLKGMSSMGILYITNNTPITFQVKSSGAGGINVYRSQMVIGTP